MKQNVETAARSCLQGSHCSLAKILGTTDLGRGQSAVMVSLYRRLAGAERALLFGLGSAHGATYGKDLSER
jgi:hypothetical protein